MALMPDSCAGTDSNEVSGGGFDFFEYLGIAGYFFFGIFDFEFLIETKEEKLDWCVLP